jgi:putative inorganic carbon (hco3(-)) transporter
MFTDSRLKWMYGFSAGFIALNLILMVNGFYWLSALPLAAAIFLLYFFSLDKLVLLLVFLTPFTFKYKHPSLGFTLDVPTEPIIVTVMLLFFIKIIYDGRYNKQVLLHPVTIIILLQLVWIFVTSITSEIPLVSFKFLLSRLWFVVTFFFVAMLLFKDIKNVRRFMWLFGTSLAIMVIFFTFRHSQFDFERQVGTWITSPFFNDHTNYSVVLAFVAPFFIAISFNKVYSPLRKRAALIFFLIFCMGILFSYSRASWVSLGIAAAGFVVLYMRIPTRFILAGIIVLGGTVFLFQNEIIMQLEGNKQESSGDFAEHFRSISNITSDASNLERINRWKSAVRMYEQRPVVGWGPGTYQFLYAPFQNSEDRTIITTNFGDIGNAHSEYIGPLAESGLPGMMLMIALAMAVLATGVRLYKTAKTRELRLMALGITLGFISYFTHGLMNNFLDTDKVSVLFWGMMGILVAMDVFLNKEDKPTTEVELQKDEKKA